MRLFASALVAIGLLVVAAASFSAQPADPPKPPRTILIIRHAEKTDDADDVHLSKKGRERADALGALFKKTPTRPKPFPSPDFIFATRSSNFSQRPVETVTPLALTLKLSVNSQYRNQAMDDPPDPKKKAQRELAEELLSGKYAGKTVLICWHHGTIPELARLLGAADCPKKWKAPVFDRVWQINYDERGQASFSDLPQQLLPGDSAK
jgi:broad specificity phosphatase PhoE